LAWERVCVLEDTYNVRNASQG